MRPERAVRWSSVVAVLMVGCGASDPCPVEPQIVSDLGIGFYADPECPEWTRVDDVADRVDAIATVVAQHMSADPKGLRGYVVVFRSSDRILCDEKMKAVGCMHFNGRWIEATCVDTKCAEASILAHELLHAWLPDPDHSDPRWSTLWQTVYSAFQDQNGNLC